MLSINFLIALLYLSYHLQTHWAHFLNHLPRSCLMKLHATLLCDYTCTSLWLHLLLFFFLTYLSPLRKSPNWCLNFQSLTVTYHGSYSNFSAGRMFFGGLSCYYLNNQPFTLYWDLFWCSVLMLMMFTRSIRPNLNKSDEENLTKYYPISHLNFLSKLIILFVFILLIIHDTKY